jgi:hypothetical protein
VDARYQWRIDRKKNVPVSVPEGKLAQLLVWNLYRVLRERNMVGGFTRHIAVSHLCRHQGARVKVGGWPLEERGKDSMPIHLFQKGCTIVWGGHVVSSEGVKGKEVSENDHQPTHSDYGSTGLGGAEQWEVMDGLSHPCTYNTPIEDYREIEWYDVEQGNVFDAEKNGTNCKIGMGEILVMHADTGKSHIWEEGKWHHSLHWAVESWRYPRIDGGDAIDLVVAPETVMRSKDIHHRRACLNHYNLPKYYV